MLPYIIGAVVVLIAVVGVIALTRKKKVDAPPAAHQGSFQPIFPSQYGGNTYEMDQKAGLTLFCTEGAMKGQEIGLPPTGGVLGSGAQAQAKLSDSGVAARHAELKKDGAQYTLVGVDGQSFSHNGQKTKEAKLSSGDTLILGGLTFKVQVNG